ncbi:MAG: hypothetical protein A2W33_08540 [Chloroflexi bacterium RBG_16_52_11]|nr:MAG: hypothetical protein A2W33_08540 [Chloroflexi bacterium RBG_16_52_11]
MGPTSERPDKNRPQSTVNLTLAAVAGQVGCLTLVIVLAALIVGLWLDAQLGTKPMITLILMIASVPVTLVVMFWVVRAATARMQPGEAQNSEKQQEDASSGKNS